MPSKRVKISDLDKEWIKPRKGKNKIISPEYHLIISEGTKTEPNYFQELSNLINNKYKGRVILIPKGKAKGTLQLLEEAKREHMASKQEIKHVWLVYDKDDFEKDDFDNTFHACEEMKDYCGACYHALYSNACIELWFLLHFKNINVGHNRKEYLEMLNKEYEARKLGNYNKNDTSTCSTLLPYLNTAIKNAKRLDETYKDETPWKSNPRTKVYELLEILRPYLK